MAKSEGNPKAPGWLSSIIAIILALLLLHTFPLMGNWIDNRRAGQGKFDFDEDLCFDINDKKQFDNTAQVTGSTGTGAMMYKYYHTTARKSNSPVNVQTIPLNETLDGFAVASTIPNPAETPVPNVAFDYSLQFFLNFTKKKMLDLDIVEIVMYLDISGVTFSTIDFFVSDESLSKKIFDDRKANIGNITKIKVKVNDLLELNTLQDEKLIFGFVTKVGEFIPGNTFVVFDMQWYCIEEIKTPTLTTLAGWLAVMNTVILLVIFVSFPQIQILGRFDGVSRRLKKI